MRFVVVFFLLAMLSPGISWAAELPDPAITPGAANTTVNQANIHETICVKGWTKTIRPPVGFTNRIKHLQMRRYGIDDYRIHEFELDHLIPLNLGGAPDDPANLWPQPFDGEWNAGLKDDLERTLNLRVCQERLTLAEAQTAVRTDWIAAYRKFMSKRARGNRGRPSAPAESPEPAGGH